MITAEVNIRVGDANRDGKADIMVESTIGGLRLPRVGPINLDVHAAVRIVTGLVDSLRDSIGYAVRELQVAPPSVVGSLDDTKEKG